MTDARHTPSKPSGFGDTAQKPAELRAMMRVREWPVTVKVIVVFALPAALAALFGAVHVFRRLQVVADATVSAGERTVAGLEAAAVVVLLVLAFLAALWLARSLALPLARVRDDAEMIADDRLPSDVAEVRAGRELPEAQRIEVHTQEETGQLARAVERVYGRARELAGEQAVLQRQVSTMFETLSRRNSTLVDQQLAIIESLERDEENAERLEQLFEIDHIAARLRRNGESLLVLSGSRSPVQRSEALSLEDVARAAVSEVRDYQRIDVRFLGDETVKAQAGADLVHLLAELIDNAAAFSSPTTRVEVAATRPATGGVTIEVADQGLGVAASELETLNAVLSSHTPVSAETTRRMGIFVISRLAETHGFAVSLREGENGGIVASVAIPDALLTRPGLGDGLEDSSTDPKERVELAASVPTSPVELVDIESMSSSNAEEHAPEPIQSMAVTNSTAVVSVDANDADAAAETEEVAADEAETEAPQDAEDLEASAEEATADDDVAAGPEAETVDASPEADAAEQSETAEAEDTVDESVEEPAEAEAEAEAEAAEPEAAAEPHAFEMFDTPIFRSTASRWLQPADELTEGGWGDDIAEAAAAAASLSRAGEEPAARTAAGLPKRRPGGQLLPGGVSDQSQVRAERRDPNAVRESLSRHFEGVRRARIEAQVTVEENENRQPRKLPKRTPLREREPEAVDAGSQV